jgi:hypothetical protein
VRIPSGRGIRALDAIAAVHGPAFRGGARYPSVFNRLASARLPKRSGNTGANFNLLNHASELSRIRDNSDYSGRVIMPSRGARQRFCRGQGAAAA